MESSYSRSLLGQIVSPAPLLPRFSFLIGQIHFFPLVACPSISQTTHVPSLIQDDTVKEQGDIGSPCRLLDDDTETDSGKAG